MSNGDNMSAFSKLKPLCVNVIRDCTIENINKLEEAVKILDADSIQALQGYILVPFRAHLSSKLSEKLAIKCIEFCTLIFKRSCVCNWTFFNGHFALMMSKIGGHEDISRTVRERSEEFKICVCENMLWLIRCSSEEILNEMYSLSFRPNLAYTFVVFNTLLRQEKCKALLQAVLSTVGALTYKEKYLVKKYLSTEFIASEALASCLPGLSIALQKVICNDDKQSYNIIVMALSVLINLIILTVGDESFDRGISKNISSDTYQIAYIKGKASHVSDQMNKAIPVVIKDDAWFKDVSEKIEILIKNITNLSSHKHWKVRLKYLKCVKALLLKCTKTLPNCIPVVLPSVFGLSVDDNESVSSFARDFLVSLSEMSENTNYSAFQSIIDTNIKTLISDLIKFKHSANDDKKLTTLKCLLGYVGISDLSFKKPFSMINLERIVLTLLTLLEFDVSESNLVEEIPSTSIETFDVINPLFPKKKFKLFQNEEILRTICQLCYSLGQNGNARLLIDYLLEKLSGNNLHTLQCIFVIGSVIKGLAYESDAPQKYSAVVCDVLEILLSDTLLDVPTHESDEKCLDDKINQVTDLSLPNNVFSKNKLQVCLILEVIAHCAECLKADFKLQLIKALCPVMEKAGSNNFIISHCGKLCLFYIAKFCQYDSIQELIKDNADYVTNILLINFHQYLYKPEIVTVLTVAIKQSDAESLVLFRDLIFKVLNLLDYNQNKAYPLMVVLYSVMVYIKKWFPCKEKSQVLSIKESCKSLRALVSEYIDLKKVDCKSEYIEENESSFDDASEDVLDNKPDIPLHVTIVCEIFKRCTLLQSSKNQYLRLLTLETVELCILSLRDYENQLLPLVHEFWNPFLRRFTEDTFIAKAFNVLLIIANECGDFIRHRSLKDIIPKVVFFLEKEHNKSLLKCSYKHYQHSNDHSLQILALSEIGNFCTKLDIDDKEINAIANVCLPYLEKKQPKVLQEAAAKSLKALATLNPDAIYFYWNVLYSTEKSLIPPSKKLLEIPFPFCDNSLISMEFPF